MNALHQPPAELRKAEAMDAAKRRKARNWHCPTNEWSFSERVGRPYENRFDDSHLASSPSVIRTSRAS